MRLSDDLAGLLARPKHRWVGKRGYLIRTVWYIGGSYAEGVPVEVVEGFEGGHTLMVRFPDGVERIVLACNVEVAG